MPLSYHFLALTLVISLLYMQYLTQLVYAYPTFFLIAVIYLAYLQVFYLPTHTNNETRFVVKLNPALLTLSIIAFCMSLVYNL